MSVLKPPAEFAAAACRAVCMPAWLEQRYPRLPVVFAEVVTGPTTDGDGASDDAVSAFAGFVHTTASTKTSKYWTTVI